MAFNWTEHIYYTQKRKKKLLTLGIISYIHIETETPQGR